jgi:type I restriction-modification system DNA methylase subunit
MKKTGLTVKKEYGDFQTPIELSHLMMNIINDKNILPDVIIEPTCGIGNVLITAYNYFHPQKALGIEINKEYCKAVSKITNENNNILIFNNDIFVSFDTLKKERK